MIAFKIPNLPPFTPQYFLKNRIRKYLSGELQVNNR